MSTAPPDTVYRLPFLDTVCGDPLFPVEIGQRLEKHWGKRATLKIIEGGKHTPNMDFGGEFNQLVVDFLK